MHSLGEHNALAVNWEAPLGELVCGLNKRVKRGAEGIVSRHRSSNHVSRTPGLLFACRALRAEQTKALRPAWTETESEYQIKVGETSQVRQTGNAISRTR